MAIGQDEDKKKRGATLKRPDSGGESSLARSLGARIGTGVDLVGDVKDAHIRALSRGLSAGSHALSEFQQGYSNATDQPSASAGMPGGAQAADGGSTLQRFWQKDDTSGDVTVKYGDTAADMDRDGVGVHPSSPRAQDPITVRPSLDQLFPENVDGTRYRIGEHGEKVFSNVDGPNGPATFSSARLQRRIDSGQEPGVNVADYSATKPRISEIIGHTPTPEEAVQYRMDMMQRADEVQSAKLARQNGPTAAENAEANMLAAALQDPRSQYGIAARNLEVAAGDETKTESEAKLVAQRAKALFGAPLSASKQTNTRQANRADNRTTLRREGVAQRGATRRGRIRAKTDRDRNQKTYLARSQNPVTLADGTLATQNTATNTVRRNRLQDGKPAKSAGGIKRNVKANRKQTQQYLDVMKNMGEYVRDQIKLMPAGEERAAAMTDAKLAYARSLSVPTRQKDGQAAAYIAGQWRLL